jgi:RNA polymerase sigma-70 factor, ECF subfamily
MVSDTSAITALIQQWQAGSREAADKLIERVYPELKKIAAAYLNSERRDHTLAPTALVHELYLKFVASCPATVQNRTHFFAAAARSLRHILVDHARLHQAKKRGGNRLKVTLSAANSVVDSHDEDLLGVDEALRELQQLDPRAAQVIELRFFGGLNEEEVAQVLGISRKTVQRDWRTARAWLMSRLATANDSRQRS